MDRKTVLKLLLVTVLPYHCALQASLNLHSLVPSTCPSNRSRTRVVQTRGTDTLIIGEINRALLDKFFAANQNFTALEEYYVNTGGIYLLPVPVPFNGKLTSLTVYGFPGKIYNSTSEDLDLGPFLPTPSAPTPGLETYLFAVVYRPAGALYRLVHGLTEVKQGFTPSTLPSDSSRTLAWDVEEGDYIGVYIPELCLPFDNIDGCSYPSQVNLVTEDCTSALYHPAQGRVDGISKSEFQEVSLWLNMEAFLLEETGDDFRTMMIVIVVVVLVVCIAAVTVVVSVLCCVLMSRQTDKRTLLSSPTPMAEKQELGTLSKDLEGGVVVANGVGVPHANGEKRPSYAYISNQPQTLVEDDGYTVIRTVNIEDSIQTTKVSNTYVLSSDTDDNGYDYDYQVPYFEPANQEEELVLQLNSKLMVPEISKDDLELSEKLGSGAFGTVYRGVWSHSAQEGEEHKEVEEEVAVKTMEGEVSETDRIKFLQEATIMAQFKHPYIISLKGLLLKSQMMIVLDLMEGGDLRKHLLTSMRERMNTLEPFELASTLLSYMKQITLGMSYFQSKSFVHRDLAARNVLISKDGTICKISDFGLSRELQNHSYYVSHGGKIPVKWTAPEALHYHKYSTASDVWSYGCVLYEIWSLGQKPFQDITNQEAMKHVMAGNRLPPPPGCPRSVYTTMIQCWHPDADQRPSFCDIVQQHQVPDYVLLKWSAADKNNYSEEARRLGALLDLGKELFQDLQRTYLASSKETEKL